jgi:hypothetical protein
MVEPDRPGSWHRGGIEDDHRLTLAVRIGMRGDVGQRPRADLGCLLVRVAAAGQQIGQLRRRIITQ